MNSCHFMIVSQIPYTDRQIRMNKNNRNYPYRTKWSMMSPRITWRSFAELANIITIIKRRYPEKFDPFATRFALCPWGVNTRTHFTHNRTRFQEHFPAMEKKAIEIEIREEPTLRRLRYKVFWYDETRIPLSPPPIEWNYIQYS